MSYTTLVAVFMIIVVKLACKRRARKPVVPNDNTWFRPPARYCCRNNSATGTLTPALDACWICATSTSIGSVSAALNTPPISDEMTCSLVVSTRSGLLRLYTMFSPERRRRSARTSRQHA
ncbi:hypothetical protein GQ600_12639 [Phytophthora cactorum]|nr:hypothetical protein GQ600_12639 [Phytophthora cactorum]